MEDFALTFDLLHLWTDIEATYNYSSMSFYFSSVS